MALQKQKMQIPLTAGIDDKIAKIVKGPNILEDLKNVDLVKRGEITKRLGSSLFDASADTLKAVDEYNDEFMILTDSELKSIPDGGSKRTVGDLQLNFTGRKKAVLTGRETPLNAYSVNENGLTFFGMIDGNNIDFGSRLAKYSLLDNSNESWLKKDVLVEGTLSTADTAGSVRVVASATHFYLAYTEAVGSNVNVFRYDRTGTQLTERLSLTTCDTQSTVAFDMVHNSNNVYIAIRDGLNLKLFQLNETTLATVNSVTLALPRDCRNVMFAPLGSTLQLFYTVEHGGTQWQFWTRRYDLNLNQQNSLQIATDNTGNKSGDNISCVFVSSNGTCLVYFDGQDNSLTPTSYYVYDVTGNTASDDHELLTEGFSLASRPIAITDGARLLMRLDDPNNVENTLFLLEHKAGVSTDEFDDTRKFLGKYHSRTLGSQTIRLNYLFSLDTEGFSALKKVYQTLSSGGVPEFRSDFIRTDFIVNFQPETVVFKDLFYISGNYLQMYDGDIVTEDNFLYNPFKTGIIGFFTTGGFFSDGVVLCKFLYRWVDAQGNIHQSAPSTTETVTLTGGTATQKFTIHCSHYNYGSIPPEKVEVILYRTELDGTVFYRDQSKFMAVGFITQFLDITFEVTDSNNADLLANETLYTAGQAPNSSVASCEYLTVFDDRLCVMGGEHLDEVIYSKPSDYNFYAIERKVTIPKGKNHPNGFRGIDSKLVVFKKQEKYTIFGTGADVSGNGNYEPAATLPSEQGLESSRALAVTSMGIFFKSPLGIYLLDRGLNVTYIGSPVESYNSNAVNQVISVEDKNEVRFLLDSFLLVYNYENKLWSVSDNNTYYGGTNFDSEFHFYDNAGDVYKEDSIYTDRIGLSYDMSFKTAWIKLSGLSGYQRVYRGTINGEFVDDHELIIDVFYDYETIASAQMRINVTSGNYEYDFLVTRQRCKAIQLGISFVGNNQNCTVSSVEFLVGFKGLKNRIASSKRAQDI